jgi:hypothetical protein
MSPKCLAIIVCESVVEDRRTGNKCILNTYHPLTAPKYPATHDRLTIFLSLTNGHGSPPMKLRLVNLDEGGADVLKIEGQLKFASPLQVVDIVFDMRQVSIPRPGKYEIQVWVGDELVGQRLVQAMQAQAPAQTPPRQPETGGP